MKNIPYTKHWNCNKEIGNGTFAGTQNHYLESSEVSDLELVLDHCSIVVKLVYKSGMSTRKYRDI